MKKEPLYLFFVLLFMVTACSRKPVYEESVSFQDKSWNRFRVLTFEPKVEKANVYYDIVLKISYENGFEHQSIPIHAILTSPDGQRNIIRKNVKICNKDGQYIGSVFGDIWTVEKVVFEHKQLKDIGVYFFTVQQMTQYYDLKGIISVSCIFKPSEKQ